MGGRKRGGTATVSLRVRDVAQLFNSLDPSPFWDRDLDREAAEFIKDEFTELPQVLDEGLIILAWIAMWRPVEVLAYEWVPLLHKRRLYERLAGIRVAVRPAPAPAAKA
jgi:hypothetical protein